MQERYLGRIEPGMEVCDINGDKVGTVSRVYRHGLGAGGTAATATAPPHDEVVEVKTGLLGLGTRYYVPMSGIRDATPSCVFLSTPKADFEGLGWHRRPAQLGGLE
jgi:hypothetical protein